MAHQLLASDWKLGNMIGCFGPVNESCQLCSWRKKDDCNEYRKWKREESAFPPPELLQRAVISFLLQLFQYSLMQSIYKTDNLFSPEIFLKYVPESRQIRDEW